MALIRSGEGRAGLNVLRGEKEQQNGIKNPAAGGHMRRIGRRGLAWGGGRTYVRMYLDTNRRPGKECGKYSSTEVGGSSPPIARPRTCKHRNRSPERKQSYSVIIVIRYVVVV